jgi:hypothetical protein
MTKITITIDMEGSVSSTVMGVKVAACAKADAFLLDLTGQRADNKTAEYFEAEQKTTTTTRRT